MEARDRPRVLMLGKGWFPADVGGLDRYYRELLEHLPQARGIVVGPGPDAPERVELVESTFSPLPHRLRALARAAHRHRSDVDIVDAHFALYAFWPVVLGALRGKPLVVHFQGPWADENSTAGDTSRLRHAVRRQLEGAVYRRAAVVVVLTHAFGRVAVERYGVSPWRLHVERPGVDLERFELGDRARAREELGLPADGFVAVCARRLVPRMGLELLLDSWEEIEGTLLLIGEGPLHAELQARVARSPRLGEHVRLLGRVEESTLQSAYRAADLNVVPTLSFEGFGLIVLEAAACGTPSLVTDAGGLPEAVRGAPGAQVVPSGDVEALRQALGARAAARTSDAHRGGSAELEAGSDDPRHRQAAAVAPDAASGPREALQAAVAPDAAIGPREALRAWAAQSAWPVVAERHRALLDRVLEPAAQPPLRVIVLDHVARLSGGEIALLRVLPHLNAADVRVHVITAEDGPLLAQLEQAGVSASVLPMGAASRELRKADVRAGHLPVAAVWATTRYVLRLVRLLRRERPDVLHANSLKSGLYGGVAARLAGVPLVWHLHDRLDPDYLPRAAVLLVRLAIRTLASGVVTNSASTAATLRGGPEPVIIPSALPSTLPPARVPAARERLVFGMVGRLTPWKGQHVFLEAFARAFPEDRHVAVLVGAPLFGEEDYELELRALAERLGIGGRVEFRGFRDDVWSELSTFDVLVHASTSPEPFGQVIQEAMAVGLPVLAADAGGPAEFVGHEVNGLLVARGDPARLVAPLRRLAGDAELRRRLGAAARESVGRFAPELVAAQLTAAYRAVARR